MYEKLEHVFYVTFDSKYEKDQQEVENISYSIGMLDLSGMGLDYIAGANEYNVKSVVTDDELVIPIDAIIGIYNTFDEAYMSIANA